jgi:Cysteine-rich CPXCG
LVRDPAAALIEIQCVLCPRYDYGMNMLQGQDATCPHCWETINLTLDLSVTEQSYVEDCPVCCKPMMVSYTTSDGEVAEVTVEATD